MYVQVRVKGYLMIIVIQDITYQNPCLCNKNGLSRYSVLSSGC